MPRPATGQIVERKDREGRIYRSLRFRAYGKRETKPLGTVDREKAEKALEHLMADIERGIYEPAQRVEPVPEKVIPTFHVYSEDWWVLNEGRLAKGTKADYRRRLEGHLIPWFGEMALDAIDIDEVERYKAAKIEEGLAPRTINMTLTLLATILESACERELIPRNPAKGKKRRVDEGDPQRSYLETASQVRALLDAAGELDREAPEGRQHVERRAMLAVLVFGGLRISELLALRWRDVDLAAGRITVAESKTDAGVRKVRIRGALRDELLSLRQRQSDARQDAYVFPTSTGRRMGAENFRNRVLGRPATVVDGEEVAGAGTVARANKRLEEAGRPPLPRGLTPHSLRRTFCSLLYALGETPNVVMRQMGHRDPALALRVYEQVMADDDPGERERLRALVDGAEWANMGERASGEGSRIGGPDAGA